MDMITLAMAKKYTDQKAGYVEWRDRIITWDGDTANKLIIPFEELGLEGHVASFVKISDKPIPANNITGVVWQSPDGSWFDGVGPGDIRVEAFDGGHIVKVGSTETPMVLVVDADNYEMDGVYCAVFYKSISKDAVNMYTSELSGKLGEKIHPIDPKFIPGAVLPVVEFSAVSPGEITDEAIVEQLNYALENAYAIIIHMVGGGADVSSILIKAVMPDMFIGFLMPGESLGGGTNIELKDNVWMFNA
jgi:hypothetical protein